MNANSPVIGSTTASTDTTDVVRNAKWYRAAAAIVAKDWVSIDATATTADIGGAVKSCDAADVESVGVALTAGVAGALVLVAGRDSVINGCNVSGSQGDFVQTSSTAGRAETAGAGTQRVVGKIVGTVASNAGRCLLILG